MLFRDTVGDPAADAVQVEVAAASRAAILPLFVSERGGEALAASGEALEMAGAVMRGVLQGLAVWWIDHPEVPRERVGLRR